MIVDAALQRLIHWRSSFPQTLGRVVAVLLLVACLLPSVAFAREYLIVFEKGAGELDAYADASTYLAAGERLNAGHDLYHRAPGDRRVITMVGSGDAALLSPPPIAVIWRPLAAIPSGLTAWVVACWVALLGTVTYLVIRTGLIGFAVVLALSQAIGEQLAVANVAAFFPGLLVLSWRYRSHPWAGVPLGLMAGIKLAPVAMIGWLLAQRNWRAIGWAAAAIAMLTVLGVLGAGIGSYLEYMDVVQRAGPSYMSVAGITGIAWASFGVLVAGIAIAAALHQRPGVAFVVSVSTCILGTPALYLSGLVILLGVLAPLTDRPALARPVVNRNALLVQPELTDTVR